MNVLNLPATHTHLALPEIPDALSQRKEWILAHIRPAWLLHASPVDSVERGESFIGGNAPHRGEEETWPVCPGCAREMGFVMQVHLTDELVATVPHLKRGTFQFWNCWYCVPEGDAYGDARQLRRFDKTFVSYGSSSQVARWFEGQQVEGGPLKDVEQNLPFLKRLTQEPYLSLPHPFDDLLNDWESEEREHYWEAMGKHINEDTICQVGGYPTWLQDGVTPLEPNTGQATDFVLALGTGDTDVIWGDTGFYYFFAMEGDLSEPFVLEQTL